MRYFLVMNPASRGGKSAGFFELIHKDSIYITGKIGAGNLQALKIKKRFTLRNAEAEVVRQHATSCIDTSDGAWNAVNLIAAQSKVGYELHDLPYDATGLRITNTLGWPKELLFFEKAANLSYYSLRRKNSRFAKSAS
ncbi:MAG: hypothetical protein FWF87_02325 [Synergistaceae bacterium]|nr:hypothetical protein [Synergistaceae bacterium]